MVYGGDEMDQETGTTVLNFVDKIKYAGRRCLMCIVMIIDLLYYHFVQTTFVRAMDRMVPAVFLLSIIGDIFIDKEIKGRISVLRIITAVVILIVNIAVWYAYLNYSWMR